MLVIPMDPAPLDVDLPVRVEEETRVYPVEIKVGELAVGTRIREVRGSYDKVRRVEICVIWHIGRAGEVCTNDVIDALVVPDGWRIYAAGEDFTAGCIVDLCCCPVERDLGRPVDGVPNQFPVDQILRLVDGDAGEDVEARACHVKGVPNTDA